MIDSSAQEGSSSQPGRARHIPRPDVHGSPERPVLIVVGLALIIVLTAATGYFVAQEFGYVAVDRGKLKQLADDGDAKAARALEVTGRLSFMLSGAQLGITVTALLVGYVAEPLPRCRAGRAARRASGVSTGGQPAAVGGAGPAHRHRRADGPRRAGPEEPGHRPARGVGPGAEPVHPDLPEGGRAADHALRPGGGAAAAPDRHRADRGAAQRRHPGGPGADHRRVPRGGAPRRRDVRRCSTGVWTSGS